VAVWAIWRRHALPCFSRRDDRFYLVLIVDFVWLVGQSLFTEINGLDYAMFKLFHLSVLWRAGVSTREEFRNVKLGSHEDVIRQMLLRDDPGARQVSSLGADPL
jgi:hypothetical protein